MARCVGEPQVPPPPPNLRALSGNSSERIQSKFHHPTPHARPPRFFFALFSSCSNADLPYIVRRQFKHVPKFCLLFGVTRRRERTCRLLDRQCLGDERGGSKTIPQHVFISSTDSLAPDYYRRITTLLNYFISSRPCGCAPVAAHQALSFIRNQTASSVISGFLG